MCVCVCVCVCVGESLSAHECVSVKGLTHKTEPVHYPAVNGAVLMASWGCSLKVPPRPMLFVSSLFL